jgi:hypothetical protein
MAGKKRNALKHGANAREVMLWSEKYEDYESLRAGLNQEYTPDGVTIQKRLDKIREDNEYSHDVENLRSFASEFDEATSAEKVEALLARLSPLYSNTIRQEWPLQTSEDASTWGAKIAKGLLSWKLAPRHEHADEFLKIVDLDTFDISLARIERLDAQMDRTIKRLLQLKTMKQMYGRLEPKLIDLSAARSPPGSGRD